MASFDLKFVVLPLINILKSLLAEPWKWDVFNIISHLTWLKFSLLAIIFFLFAFTSTKVILFNSTDTGYIHIQMGDLSTSHSASFIACVLLPQDLYWFAYPILILLSFCSTWVFNFFKRFGNFMHGTPVLNIMVNATFVGDLNQEMQGENQETELQAQEEDKFGDIGTYSSALDAALAYDQAAKIMYASNAILNFPQHSTHNANALDCSPQQEQEQVETKHVKQGTDEFESNQDEFWLFDNINTQIPLNQNEGGTIDMNKSSNDLKLDEFEYLEEFLMRDNFDLEPYGNSGGFGQDGDCNSVYDTAYLQNGRSYDLRCGVDNLDGLQYNVEPLMMQDESKLKHDSRFMCNDNSPSN